MNLIKKPTAGILILCFFVAIMGGIAVWGNETKPPAAQNEEILFTLLHTNDEHSSIIPHTSTVDYRPDTLNPTIGGYGRLTTAIKRIRGEKGLKKEAVLLVSAGDFLGGTAFSWLAPSGQAIELMIKHKLSYDAVTIGNHEFDYGVEVLTNYLKAAGYPKAHDITPVLATNIIAGPDNPLSKEGLYKDYKIIELEAGIKVGFFGLIGKEAISYATNTKPLAFEDQHNVAEKSVKELKAMGADIIIALSHSGLEEDLELATEVEGINVIVGSHCHTALFEPRVVGKTIIVQAGAYLEYLGMLELAYNPQSGELRHRNKENNQAYLIPIDSSIPEDPEMADFIREKTLELNSFVSSFTNGVFSNVIETIAKTDFTITTEELKESSFGNLVTDAMRLIAEEKTGDRVDVAIQANGSIRGSLVPGSMEYAKGLVSFYDLVALIGLGYGEDGNAGYPIVSFYLTGDEIRRALEVAALLAELKGDTYFLQFSGLRYNYNPNDVVLLEVPFKNIPIPTTRAVKKAELYVGNGIQTYEAKDYVSLNRGNQELYHIVSDSYILSFLPMAGQLLPQLDIVPKDKEGNPVAVKDFHKLVVYNNGQQLKVWQTVAEYVSAQEKDSDGIPKLPGYYANTSGRINTIKGISFLQWILIILAGIVVFFRYIIVRRKRKRLEGTN